MCVHHDGLTMEEEPCLLFIRMTELNVMIAAHHQMLEPETVWHTGQATVKPLALSL